MKKIKIVMTVAALLGLVSVPATFAKGHKSEGSPQIVPSDVYAQFDKNNNGKLEADEIEALRAEFAKVATGPLKVFDVNADGKLSDDEIAAIPATKTVDAPPKEKKHKKKK